MDPDASTAPMTPASTARQKSFICIVRRKACTTWIAAYSASVNSLFMSFQCEKNVPG
jgi:hypothetical protein